MPGSLESAAPFAVSVSGGTFKEITDSSGADFSSDVGVSVRGEIAQGKPAEQGPWCFPRQIEESSAFFPVLPS